MSSEAPGAGGPSPAEMERIQNVAASVGKSVEAGAAELKATFGGEHAVAMWMSEFYTHQQHKYAVPAISLVCQDERQVGMPTLAAKNAAFFAALFRNMPPETFVEYAATLTLVKGIDLSLVLAILHGVGSKHGKAMFDRMGVSIRRAGHRPLVEAAQHVAATPGGVPAAEWAFPWESASSSDMASWKTAPLQPWEAPAIYAEAREALPAPEWLLLASTTVLEGLWAEFYATGDKAVLRRILDAAVPWAEFASMPEAISYVLAVDKTLPEPLRALGESATPEAALRSVRAHVSRAAMWSLLHHTRRHPRVTEGIAEAVASLAQWIAEPAVRSPEAAAASGISSEAEAEARLTVWPALLHLVARGRLDAPFSAPAAGGAK